MKSGIRTSLPAQIIGSFEDLGKGVVHEAAKVPADLAGKALESLGTAGGRQGQPRAQTASQAGERSDEQKTALTRLSEAQDNKVKRSIARAALTELAGEKAKPKEPSVWEKQQAEIEQKRQQHAQQQVQASKRELPKMWQRPKPGNLWQVTKQKAGTETSRNVRGD